MKTGRNAIPLKIEDGIIGHIQRHEELLHIKIEGNISDKRDQGQPRTSYIK